MAFTFSSILEAIYDRMGVTAGSTSQSALAVRLANQAKDKFVEAAKWPFLEYSSNLVFLPSTRNYVVGTDVQNIVAIYASAGDVLEPVERHTYDRIFRRDTATASAPTHFSVHRFSGSSQPNVNVWRTPTATSTGTIQYTRRIVDLTNAGSTSPFAQIPSECYVAIIEMAEAMFEEWEDSPQAQPLWQKANQTLAMMAQRHGAPLLVDAVRR